MKNAAAPAQPTSQPRKALAQQLAVIADLAARIASLTTVASKPGRKSQAGGAPDVEAGAEHARLQQMLVAAVAKRDDLIEDIMANEVLPHRIGVYQNLVMQVNVAWNDILAYDSTVRRHFPGRPSVFNTAGPHERAVVAPSTDNSPVPAQTIDSRKLFAAANNATACFVEALATDADAGFGRG
jgi:hypothetical protein